ncbi:hypothetical protein PXH67_21625 [Streptomyces sp. P8-A8]|uniref:hypothetical protein n=1 Tax=Streptomyces sp. P8-A8 TaxID=3029759 RepID=UPI0036DDC56E
MTRPTPAVVPARMTCPTLPLVPARPVTTGSALASAQPVTTGPALASARPVTTGPALASARPVTTGDVQQTVNLRTNTEKAMNVPHPPGRPPVTGLPRRYRRFLRAVPALALAASLAAVAGCSSSAEADDLRTPCGLVVDGSGSGAAGGRGFDAEAKLKATLVPFLTERHCGTLSFAPVTRSSQTSSCRVGDVDLNPPGDEMSDRDSMRRSARLRAAQGALAMLKCARTQGGSDVIGALARIGDAVPSGKGTPSLLVVSDFEQADKEFTLRVREIATEESRERAVDTLLGDRGVPGIAGMDVYPVGYGMSHDAKPSEYRPFDAFWSEILTGRAKAHVHDDYRK